MKRSGTTGEAHLTVICSYCGKLLDGQESWSKGDVELNSSNNTHGTCPDCLLENFPREYLAIQEERRVRIKNVFKKGYRELYGHLVR